MFLRALVAAAFMMIAAQPALAFEYSNDNAGLPLQIENAYAFATMPGATTGAAFMIIHNKGSEDDKLLEAKSNVAEITEIHENMIDPDDGTMMMRKIKALDIPANGQVELQPKGYHVMFIKMTEPLAVDGTVDVTLIFEKAGAVKTTAKVVAPGLIPKQEKIMPWDTDEEESATE